MSKTVESQFVVQDVVNGDIWLEDLQRGFIVAVEADDSEYSGQLKRKVQQLSEGDRISATLESQNNLHTIWNFADISFEGGEKQHKVFA